MVDIVGAIAVGRRRRGRTRDIIDGGFHLAYGSFREVVGGTHVVVAAMFVNGVRRYVWSNNDFEFNTRCVLVADCGCAINRAKQHSRDSVLLFQESVLRPVSV